MIITVVMLLLLGMLEFGFLFDHHLTLEYATREGARVGAALGQRRRRPRLQHRPVAQRRRRRQADHRRRPARHHVARVARSSKSRVSRDPDLQVDASTGGVTGSALVKQLGLRPPGGGPVGRRQEPRLRPDGTPRAGRPATATTARRPDSIGVSLKYDYELVTPLSAVMGFFGPARPDDDPDQ